MSKYSLLQIPALSFFATDVYRDMANNKEGVGFGYLFLLLAFCWLLIIIVLDSSYKSYLDENAPGFLSQFPEITIIDGQASIKEMQPYYIDDPKTGQHIAVIDTKGTINSLEQTDAVILLTKTSVIFEKNQIETRSFDLSEVGDVVIDRALISSWVEATKSWFAVFMYPFALAGSYLYRIIQMLIYAAIGLLFVSICKAELEYTQLLRLSVVAVTPSIIINTLLWMSGTNLPFAGFMYFILTMIYLFLGIKATTEGPAEEVDS
ncbi:MAG: DUF1189 domain-containing protein [Proteobacteria bacterium]|nr:DUF1189 domain-containing protein [Pseudomonadota bacterium]